jgi:hypothetical protein
MPTVARVIPEVDPLIVSEAFRTLLIVVSGALATINAGRVLKSPHPHQRYIMASWLCLLVVVIGDQLDRWGNPLSWRTLLIGISLLLGTLGAIAWARLDRERAQARARAEEEGR